MSLLARLAVAAAVLAVGAVIGWAIRARQQRHAGHELSTQGLPAGLVLGTAPYCTRCASLRSRLDAAGIGFATIDAGSHPVLARSLDITAAPTLLQVLPSGHIADRESRDFSDARLAAMASSPD